MTKDIKDSVAGGTLDAVARRLGDERINRVVNTYHERSVPLKRLLATTLLLARTVFWMTRQPDLTGRSTLKLEATHLYPWMLFLFLASLAWAICIWSREKPPVQWMEHVGYFRLASRYPR